MTLHQPHHVVYTSTISGLFSFFAFSVAASNAIHGSFFSPGAGLAERSSGVVVPTDWAGGEKSARPKRRRTHAGMNILMSGLTSYRRASCRVRRGPRRQAPSH